MSFDLDDYYDSQVKPKKRKKRHTYPNKHDESPRVRPRTNSYPSPNIEDGDVCIIKEYSGNRLKRETLVKKHAKIHPAVEPSEEKKESEEPDDAELVVKCLGMVSKKIVRLLCYLGALI
jgi:hypothetical protein